MPFVAAPNIIQLELRYTLQGQQIENRVMVDNLAAVTPTALEDTAILGWNWAEASLMPLVSVGLNLREAVATDLTTDTGGQFTYAPDTTTVGADGGAALPNECAYCVSLHSASRGRSARGRIYLPAIPLSAMTNPNNLSTSAGAAFVSAVQDLIDAVAAASQQLVIVSYRHNNAPRTGGPVYFPVLSAVATDLIIDSMRRRKPGVGA